MTYRQAHIAIGEHGCADVLRDGVTRPFNRQSGTAKAQYGVDGQRDRRPGRHDQDSFGAIERDCCLIELIAVDRRCRSFDGSRCRPEDGLDD